MRKLLFTVLLVCGLVAIPLSAYAAYFTLNSDALVLLWDVFETPENSITGLDGAYLPADAFGYGATMHGEVGFTGQIKDTTNDGNPFASLAIGADEDGNSSTGNGATVADVIGTALSGGPTQSLLGYEGFALTFFNDNQSTWSVNLWITTGPSDTLTETAFTPIARGHSLTVSLNFADLGVTDLDDVTGLGFQIGGNMVMDPYDGQVDPSNGDNYHMSLAPVPEPSTVFLLGAGLLGLVAYGRRKFKK